jgi:hypothetical protein
MTVNTNKEQLELNIYRKDFNVQSNKSCLGRILRTIVVIAFLLLFLFFIPREDGVTKFIGFLIFYGGMYIGDKYFRRFYPDWPSKEKFIGKMILEKTQIKAIIEGHEEIYDLNNIQEMVVFHDQYTGYVINRRDLQRNGNALLFLKMNDESFAVLKFNIHTKQEYQSFTETIQHYKTALKYFKEYLPSEISHILKPDLSGRIIYK